MVNIPIIKPKKIPKHVAINTSRIKNYSEKNNIPLARAASLNIKRIKEAINNQVKYDIPILTIKLQTKNEEVRKALTKFFKELPENEAIHKNKTRVYIIGEWYDLEQEMVEALKRCMEQTKDYDHYFLNFCIRYDGQQEILSAVRIIGKQIQAGRYEPEDIHEETIKQNLYSSYFVPPDLIIENSPRYSGLLLWDSKKAIIYYSNKYWLEFEKKDFDKALAFYNKEG
jgi:undecaprenyl diphosphate synthase